MFLPRAKSRHRHGWWPRLALSSTAVLCSPATALAQERHVAFVQVLDAAGRPVSDAEVVALGSPWLPLLPAPADRVVATSDARGRAQLRLLPDLEYAAWAIEPPAGSTDFRCSQIVSGLRQGSAVDLQLDPTRPRQRALLTGAEHWAADLGLHVAAVAIGGHLLPVQLAADGLLPPLPEISLFVIADGQGRVVWVGPPKPQALATRDVAMPRPQHGMAVVRDPDGQPVAGAEIWHLLSLSDHQPFRLEAGWREIAKPVYRRHLGTTDREGRCPFVLPAWTDDLDWYLLATAPGLGALRFGIQKRIAVVGDVAQPLTKDAEGRREFTVQLPRNRQVRIPAANGSPVELMLGTPPLAATVVDGAIEVPVRTKGLLRLPATREDPVGYAILTAEQSAVDALQVVAFSVREPDGRPPDRAILTLIAPEREIPVPLDRLGQARLRLDHGPWLAFASSDTAVAHAEVRPGLDTERTLELKPPALAELQFLDTAGNPLGNAMVRFGLAAMHRSSDPWFQRILANKQEIHYLHRHREPRLDAEGWLRLPLLAPDAAIDLVPVVGARQFERVRLAPGRTQIRMQ